MKRLAILMLLAVLLIAAHTALAAPFSTGRPSPGEAFSGYRHTPFGWHAHVCRWSHHINVPNRNGFRDHGVYGRCRHGIIYLPARLLRVPPGTFPAPTRPRLPTPLPPTPGTPSTNQIPPRIIRPPSLPVSSVSVREANRMPRSGSIPPVPPMPLGTTLR